MVSSCGAARSRRGAAADFAQWKILILAAALAGVGCASWQASPISVPSLEPQRSGEPSGLGAREEAEVRWRWAALSREGRESLRERRFRDAEEHFASALELSAAFSDDDIRIETSLGNLVRLAALYRQLDRIEDAERVMETVGAHVESRDREGAAKGSHEARYRELARQSIPAPFAPRREPRPRAPAAPAHESFDGLIAQTSQRFGVDPALVKAVVAAESNFDVMAISRAGALGLMQLMPQTAREMGVKALFEPDENLTGGVRYLRAMLDRYGDTRLALAAYNAGPEAVDRHDGIPPFPETEAYVKRVLEFYRGYRTRLPN